MTTPAIARNASLVTACYRQEYDTYPQQGVITVTKQTALTRRIYESRPSSIKTAKSASGWREPTGWSHSLEDSTPVPTGAFANLQSNYWQTRTDFFDGSGWNTTRDSWPVFPTDLEARAVIKALLKLKNMNVNLAQCFAERDQTARLFTDTVKSVASSIRTFRRKNPVKIWNQVKKAGSGSKIPNRWLEVQYGWKPLFTDLHGAVKALNEKERDGDAYRATCVASIVRRESYSWNKATDQTGYIGARVKGDRFSVAKVHLDYVMENPFLASLSSMGITNPTELLWELTPYSFVVDWFIPIGDYLSAWDAALGWSFKGGTLTKFQKQEASGDTWFLINDGVVNSTSRWIPLSQSPGYRSRIFSMTRTVYGSSPLPRIPSLKNPLSTGHVANAMSLLVSALR